MDRLPFGVSRLDSRIGGGAPAGSVVLLAGEAGAGARELLYTSAAINGLGHTDEALFDLYYGELEAAAHHPEEVHYVSFTASEEEVREEMRDTLEGEIVDAALDAISVVDLSREYFQMSPVPREWYADRRVSVGDLGSSGRREDVIEALADYFEANADGNLLCIDSLTDLVGVQREERFEWQDIVFLVKGLRRASQAWGGVILLCVSRESLTDTQMGDLMSSVDGTMEFEWESGGNERVRTMVVREFRGVLPRLEAEDIVRFETEIHDGGFDVTDVRKIR